MIVFMTEDGVQLLPRHREGDDFTVTLAAPLERDWVAADAHTGRLIACESRGY